MAEPQNQQQWQQGHGSQPPPPAAQQTQGQQQQPPSQGQPGSSNPSALYNLILELTNPKQRESALMELSKRREQFPDLAPILWHSFGTIAAILQEIVSIYTYLSPATLTGHDSNRVCNALALLQCIASHAETRSLFLGSHLPLYLYPFLNTVHKSKRIACSMFK